MSALSREFIQNLQERYGHKVYRHNTVLRTDQWKQISDEVMDVAHQQMAVFMDVVEAGLTTPLGGIGVTEYGYDRMSGMEDAELSMELEAGTNEDRVDFDRVIVPIPILQKRFRISQRQLMSSQRPSLGASGGRPLDVTSVSEATRLVSELAESLVINGSTRINVNGNQIYGLRNEPHRNQGTASNHWTRANAASIHTDLNVMIRGIIDANYGGGTEPWHLYVNPAQYQILHDYPSDNTDRTIFQRLQNQLPQNPQLKASHFVPAGEAILVRMNRRVLTLAIAADLQVLEWGGDGPEARKWMVWMSFSPLVKSDKDEQSGIYHMTGLAA
jgi:uncharacterized linocin/CFP29 family protein